MAATTLLMTAGCVVDSPVIETTGVDQPAVATATPAVVATPAFEPTAPPIVPTPTPPPTPTPEPPSGPTPIPAITPTADVLPTLVSPGPVSVPIGGTTTFILASERPVLQLPGHTLIYVDDNRLAEVDIFTPVATIEGTALNGYDDVLAVLRDDPRFDGLDELDPVTIAGLRTQVFEGIIDPAVTEQGSIFLTDQSTIGNDAAGWLAPARLRLWLIDAPSGPIALTAEAVENPGQYSDAVRLATEILTTVTFS